MGLDLLNIIKRRSVQVGLLAFAVGIFFVFIGWVVSAYYS